MRTVTAGGLEIGDGHPPRIMGVLNMSPESPYDPSIRQDPDTAAAYVDEMIDEGADIIDIGLASANKRVEPRSADEELTRLDLAIETIGRVSGQAVFSIETRYADVADRALDRGFDMVNDICGFADPRMPEVCEAHDAAVVKMAGPGDLERPGALEAVDDIYEALADRLTDRTIIDPAFGGWSEAKTLADDRELFRRLGEFRGLGRPILVSINRKNFLRKLAGRSTEEALPVSLAATSMAVERGATVIRTHDVSETRDAAIVGYEFKRHRLRDGDLGIEELEVSTARELARHVERVGGTGTPQLASDSMPRVFELSGITQETRSALVAAGGEEAVDIVVGDESILLVGPTDRFRRLGHTVSGDHPRLDRILERITASR